MELASELIAEHCRLRGLAWADPQALVGLPGTGQAKAARVCGGVRLAKRLAYPGATDRCRVVTTADVAAVAAPLLRDLRHERVIVVVCDTAGTFLRTARLTDGANDRSLIPVRDILTLVLASGGSSFEVAHNHPHSDPTLSLGDRRGLRDSWRPHQPSDYAFSITYS
ncbi:hypothetical protein J7E87_14910 [Streptomyces sp. ISL-1]|uniref:JAB domain-containing protein n=1 Tax=Streptomyces sp. ISL-1 TaxID=2817657 RepID=UPI001BE9D6CC|nr:hypothetical protein [Streptomyces sp. ISL-1]